MAKAHVYLLPGANVEATDTFASWVDTTNQLVYDMGTVVLTTTSNPQPNTSVGGYTVGNAHVQGIMSANTIVATDGLRGGSTSASGNLIISSNTIFSESTLVQIGSNTNNFTVNANNSLFTGNVAINSSKTFTVNASNTQFQTGSVYMKTNTEFTGNRVDIDAGVLDITSPTTFTTTSTYFNVDTISLGANNLDSLVVNAASDFNSSVNFNGTINATANATFNGAQHYIQSTNTIIGNATTDRLNVTAYLSSDLIPASTTVDLGTDSLPYGNVHTTYVWADSDVESLGEFVLKGTTTKTIRTTGSNGSYQNLNLTFSNNSVSNTSVVANTSGLFGGVNQLYSLGSSSVNWKELYVQNSFVTGNEVITGDLAVNGGDITTSATTFNFISSNATTVNAFSAANTLIVGSTTGSVNLRNATVTLSGNTLVSSNTTVNLINTTTTTVNAFGAATSVNIGAAAGSTTINNNLVTSSGITINGAATTGLATFSLIDSVATTVNAFGAATSVNIGAAATVVNVGKTTGNGSLNIRGNGAAGTATLTSNVTTGKFAVAPSISTGTIELGSAATGKASVLFNTSSSSTSTGALVVAGGVGVSENLNVGGNVDVTGNLTVDGDLVLTKSDISLAVNTAYINDLTVNDTLTFSTATISSSITPTANVTYDVGTSALNWNALYVKDAHIANSIDAPTANVSTLTSGSIVVGSGSTDSIAINSSIYGTLGRRITIKTPDTTLSANVALTLANGNTVLQPGTMAVTGTGLGQFASTTSAQLAAVISDETGSGALVFGNAPTITNASLVTPTIGGAGATYSGSTSGSTVLRAAAAAGTTTITMPAVSGTMALTSDVKDATITISPGTGMTGGGTFTTNQSTASEITVTNADPGSAQNIFKNIAVTGQPTVVADNNNDTVTLTGAGILSITANTSTDTITFTATEVDTLSSVTGRGATTGSILTLTNTTDSTATNNGALIISGGVGVTKSLNVGGNVTISGNLVVSGTTTTINTSELTVEDLNIVIGNVSTPTDTTANGGGITLRGTTDKTLTWDNTNDNWTSSENWNLATGKTFKINNTTVLSSTSLGTSITSSSLTSVGTLTSGVWNAGVIAGQYGGTGVNNSGKTITLGGNLTTVGAFGLTLRASATTDVTLPTTGTLATLSGSESLSNKTLVSPNISGAGAQFNGSTSGSTTLKAAAAAGSTTITMPAVSGTMALTSDIGNGTLTMQTSGIATGSATFTADQSTNSTFTVNVPATNLSLTTSSTNAIITSSTGSSVTLTGANTTTAGLITAGSQTMNGNKAFEGYVLSRVSGGSVGFYAAAANDATSTTTTVDSPYIYLRGAYWNGTASANYDCKLAFDVTSASPAGKFTVDIGSATDRLVLTNAGHLTTAGNITTVNITSNDISANDISAFNVNVNGLLQAYNLATFNAGLKLPDNDAVIFGTGGDASINHSGANLWIDNNVGNTYFTMSNDQNIIFRDISGTAVDRFTFAMANGNFTAGGNVTAYSDERLKTNIRTIDGALDKVDKLRGVYFDKDGKAGLGVIAQEVEKVLPEVVLEGEYKSVAYGNIVGVLIEAIKELKAEIEELKRGK